MNAIRVAAPATTANLGPGYDCLGMALDLWNTIEVQPLPPSAPPSVTISGEGAGELEPDPNNLVYRAMQFLYRELNRPLPPLRLHCQNNIPLARGLGSSAAAIAAGLVAANTLAAHHPANNENNPTAGETAPPFTPRDILEMAATIEGHPDNVAAAVMGGLQLVITAPQNTPVSQDTTVAQDTPAAQTAVAQDTPAAQNAPGPQNAADANPNAPYTTPDSANNAPANPSALYTVPVNIPPGIHAVLFIPQTRIATEAARAALPPQIPMTDAVHNIARAALLIAGMSANRPEYLSLATQDKLHQPYRQPLFPPMKLLIKAAMDAGALGAFLSGSGSTVLALTQGREMTVAYEMAEAARQSNTDGNIKITQPTPQGAHTLPPP